MWVTISEKLPSHETRQPTGARSIHFQCLSVTNLQPGLTLAHCLVLGVVAVDRKRAGRESKKN